MPDVQVNPAPGNRSTNQKKRSGTIFVLAFVLGTAGVLVYPGPQHSTNASEGAATERTLPLEAFVVELEPTQMEQR
jgi:hypothetical protein